MKRRLLFVIMMIIIMAFTLCACGKSQYRKLGKLTKDEKVALDTMDKMFIAIENKDIEAIDKIVFPLETYRENHMIMENSVDQYSYYRSVEDGEIVMNNQSATLGFVKTCGMITNNAAAFSTQDYMTISKEAAGYVAELVEQYEKEKLSLDWEYQFIYEPNECEFSYKEGLKDVYCDPKELVPAQTEKLYVVGVKYNWSFGDKKYGIDKSETDKMNEILGETIQNYDSVISHLENFSNRVMIVYYIDGKWYVKSPYNYYMAYSAEAK